MKIKNQAAQQINNNRQASKKSIANKENSTCSDYQPKQRRSLRSKSTFGADITKRMNEPSHLRYNYTNASSEASILLPAFLKKPTAFTSQVTPYVEDIIDYIIETHNSEEFSMKYLIKMKKKNLKRVHIVERLYKYYKRYRLRRKTFHLAIYYYDKFLSINNRYDNNFNQLTIVADACMLIAMKYEQIYPPLLSKWAPEHQQAIIIMQSKILLALDFKLAQTTAQHYLEIYQGKNVTQSAQENKLHQLVLDLYLFTANIYQSHPLKVVQQILESFRSTVFMQKGTNYEHSDYNVKKMIQSHQKIWMFLLEVQQRQKTK